MIKIAPSILAADPLNLEQEARRVAEAGCDWIHVDIMDGRFVPNLAYAPDTVRALKRVVDLPLDVHLMMIHPETLVDRFLDAGADVLTFHAESEADPEALLIYIRNRGVKAGLAIKPATPVSSIAHLLPLTDMVLTMTVEPGFGGQKLDERVPIKMKQLRDLGYTGLIEADGGIREDNVARLYASGLDVAVMGTALFHLREMPEAVRRMHEIVRQA